MKGNVTIMKTQIMLHDIKRAGKFVSEITPLVSSFDIGHGSMIVDAKSIIGLAVLDLSKPLDLYCHVNPDEKEKVDEILKGYVA